ncbi:hypothetical protein L9W92_14980 [Pelotomaculum terephthalicicum JT]|uniref:hypothetical protein n=1 Tax=Pelotomaculum TaxID=191373 RepID=UPI0009C45AAD|nr:MULTISPECIES: hypothetical protein [Pelotomaculum]MCG9969320.1 hypothetical protein [Pelotomaculum terephthalicicum JT]OPX89165.1 MAG: hypothetical protein A4E54_01081 [Pelotomaculum sp. PtaB.Bin117]
MLAVALNCIGAIGEEEFGPALVKLFNDFMVVKLIPHEDLAEARLQLCQPAGYGELQKDIEESWNPSESLLELRGPNAKLRRMVRQMFFFDEEKKFEKVLLEGCDGITDFPWAVQIVVMQLPVGWEQVLEWIYMADIIVLIDSESEVCRDFAARLKTIGPDIPVFLENVQEGLSNDLKVGLEVLFADYIKKRDEIKDILESQYPEQLISCAQAHRMAGKLGVSLPLVGNVCDEHGYRVTYCRLGCF